MRVVRLCSEPASAHDIAACGDYFSDDCFFLHTLSLFEYLGRRDAQVKHRGHRIQLTEIENALAGLPGVERAVVSSIRSPEGDTRLIAYVLREKGCGVTAAALHDSLRPLLAGHMLPSGFVLLDEFPLTPHGKVDREALLLHHPENPAPPVPEEEPATETERWLAGVWEKTFVHGPVGRAGNFFYLGGDSLHAAVVSAQVHAAYGITLRLQVFASHPTLSDLARAIDDLRPAKAPGVSPGITRVPRDRALPLSFEQERIWKYSQTPAQSASYVITGSHRIRGPLDVAAFRESIAYVARRHEILLSTFDSVDGQPVQIVHPEMDIGLAEVDASGNPDPGAALDQIIHQESRRAFDLRTGPLVRFVLVKISDDERRLVRVNHHINSDGWSWKIFFRELALVHRAKCEGRTPGLPETGPLQYADYAAWQRRVFDPSSRDYLDTIEWWKKKFVPPAAPLSFPFARSKAEPGARLEDGVIYRRLDDSLLRRLDELARRETATYYTIRLAAFVALLARGAGRPDIALGIYLSNRTSVDSQKLFGFFSNLATLRLHCDLGRTFREWIGTVKNCIGEIQAHAGIPYELLCETMWKQNITPPEIRAIFGVSSQNLPASLGDAEISWMGRRMGTMPWGFSLTFDTNSPDCTYRASFDARLYDPAQAGAWLDCYSRLLDAASLHPELTLDRLLL